MLEKEFEFYIRNQEEFLKTYEGKFLIIVGEELKDTYDTFNEAYESAVSQFELGKFLIQQCLPGENSYTQTFHTRAIFN